MTSRNVHGQRSSVHVLAAMLGGAIYRRAQPGSVERGLLKPSKRHAVSERNVGAQCAGVYRSDDPILMSKVTLNHKEDSVMSSAATIQASIDSIDEEIGKLTEARQTLTDLLGDEEDTNGASEKPARRRQRSKDEDEKPARSSRSTRATSKRDQERKASSSTKASNGKGKGSKAEPSSRKEQIEAMLNDGMAPREVADELGIATNYVYNVRRTM